MNIETVKELPVGKIRSGQVFSVSSEGLTSYTHGFFKYPCKFIPHIPRWALRKYSNNRPAVILDPFCGSGTTLVESVLLGHHAIGIDFDPFSCLISQVKSTPLSNKQIELFESSQKTLFYLIGQSHRKLPVPVIPNIDLWFSKAAVSGLVAIKSGIHEYIEDIGDKAIENFLLLCFSSIIRKVSNADNQSPKPYVSRKIKKTPANPLREFSNAIETYFEKLKHFSMAAKGGGGLVFKGDARHMDLTLKKAHISHVDMAITSPPYINAFDYVRSLKLENMWLGKLNASDLANHHGNQIGTERVPRDLNDIGTFTRAFPVLQNRINQIRRIDPRRATVVGKYFFDMQQNLLSVHGFLKKGGLYCIVVGDSLIRNTTVPTHNILIEIAESLGYSLDSLLSYVIKNPYLRFPRQGRGGLIKQDWIISLIKQ